MPKQPRSKSPMPCVLATADFKTREQLQAATIDRTDLITIRSALLPLIAKLLSQH